MIRCHLARLMGGAKNEDLRRFARNRAKPEYRDPNVQGDGVKDRYRGFG